MPTISMFYGILVKMYYDDHNPPHFHAFYNNYVAIYDFEGELVNGKMPPKQSKLISAWAIIHKDDLKANWSLAKNSEKLFLINPLN